jgi:hypothetical protein
MAFILDLNAAKLNSIYLPARDCFGDLPQPRVWCGAVTRGPVSSAADYVHKTVM